MIQVHTNENKNENTNENTNDAAPKPSGKSAQARRLFAVLKETLDASDEQLAACAERAVKKGFRRERYGAWIRDESYTGNHKVIYYCSLCNHWQSVKRHAENNSLSYMNYCPFCGALMRRGDEPSAVKEGARECT